jgi:hypothetical protein
MIWDDHMSSRQVTFLGAVTESAFVGAAVLLMATALLLRQGSLTRDQLPISVPLGLIAGAAVGALASPLLRRHPGRPGLIGGAARGLAVGVAVGMIILGPVATIILPMLWSTDVWFPPPIAGACGIMYGIPLGAFAGSVIGAIFGLTSSWDRQRFRLPSAVIGSLLVVAFLGLLAFGALWLVRPEAGELLYSYRRLMDLAVSRDGSRIALLAAEAGPMIPSENYRDVRLIILDSQNYQVLHSEALPGQGVAVQWADEGRTVLILDYIAQELLRWDPDNGFSDTRPFLHFTGISVSHDQARMAGWSWSFPDITIFELPLLEETQSIPLEEVRDVAWSADDSTLMVMAGTDRISQADFYEVDLALESFQAIRTRARGFDDLAWLSKDDLLAWEAGRELYVFDIGQECLRVRLSFDYNVERLAWHDLAGGLLFIRRIRGEDQDGLFYLDDEALGLGEEITCLVP